MSRDFIGVKGILPLKIQSANEIYILGDIDKILEKAQLPTIKGVKGTLNIVLSAK